MKWHLVAVLGLVGCAQAMITTPEGDVTLTKDEALLLETRMKDLVHDNTYMYNKIQELEHHLKASKDRSCT